MTKNPTLDLHNLKALSGHSIENEVQITLDKFLYKFLLNPPKSGKIFVIVGKGLGSKFSIQGKNPIRFYTEKYLEKLNLKYREGNDFEGGFGVLVVDLI